MIQYNDCRINNEGGEDDMLPEFIDKALERLETAGYEAYLVGGCVRDTLLGRPVSDYDVTTSALPLEVEQVFRGEKVVETGIKHGTVTALINGEPIEITTFRTDGEYLDSRHPESVTFSRNISDDLSRRDFTVNSIAMDRKGNIVDPYGGRGDVERRIIRCTGEPDVRFGEDALRIIRALRFSSILGFEIDKKTADSIHRNRELLLNISVERVFSEFKKMLAGKDIYRILIEYSDVICTLIPEMTPAVGFAHKSKYHSYDVYTHTAKSVEAIEPDETLRLAMLFHDIGKPYSYTEEDGVRHFRGHPAKSAKIVDGWLSKMHADSETKRLVTLLCSIHDIIIVPERKSVKRLFLKLSYDEIEMLCKVKRADSEAHAPEFRERGAVADEVMTIANEIRMEGECLSLKDLAVRGDDLIALGYRGVKIGERLRELLELVVDEKLPNDRDALLNYLSYTQINEKPEE